MSIQSEINRINENIANTYSVLSDMGATMPESQNSANMASTVRTIPQSVGSDDDVYIIPKVFENANWETEEWLRDLRAACLAGKKIYARVNTKSFNSVDYEFLVQLLFDDFVTNSETIFSKKFHAFFLMFDEKIEITFTLTIDEETGDIYTRTKISATQIAFKSDLLTSDDVATAIDSTGVKIYKVQTVSRFGGLCCMDFITTTDDVETYSGFYKDVRNRTVSSKYQYVMLYISNNSIAGDNHLYAFYSHKYKDTETNKYVYCFKSESDTETLLFELRDDESLTYTTINKFLTNEEINEIIGITVD